MIGCKRAFPEARRGTFPRPRHPPLDIAATVLLLLLLCNVIFQSQCAEGRELLQVHLLHRHGARTEPYVSDTNLNWDNCVLSQEGVQMALKLGQFARKLYIDETPLLPPDEYNSVTITSRTTEFERTIRTGVGFIRGLYAGNKYAIPWLWHTPPSVDHALGFYYSWPSAVLRVPYLQSFNVDNDPRTLQVIPQADLNLTGDILGCPGICETKPTTCALLAQDVTTCRLSNGGLDPRLEALMPKFEQIQEQSNSFLYFYNASDRYWHNAGPYGKLLADHIFANASAKLRAFHKTNGSGDHDGGGGRLTPEEAASNAVRLFHYSGHDITIYGFFVAIGAIRAAAELDPRDGEILVPRFTSTVILELFSDGMLRLRYAVCNQTYGSGFDFRFVPNITMGCIPAAGGEAYFAEECPLGDFGRFVATKAAAMSPDSYCYADPADVNRTRCGVEAYNSGGPTYYDAAAAQNAIFGGKVRVEAFLPPTPDCRAYRKLCPAFACGEPYFLNRSSWACVRFVYSDEQRQLASRNGLTEAQLGTRYFGVVVSTMLLGAVLGFVIRAFIYERAERQQGHIGLDDASTVGSPYVPSASAAV